jgi:hypothetical protein
VSSTARRPTFHSECKVQPLWRGAVARPRPQPIAGTARRVVAQLDENPARLGAHGDSARASPVVPYQREGDLLSLWRCVSELPFTGSCFWCGCSTELPLDGSGRSAGTFAPDRHPGCDFGARPPFGAAELHFLCSAVTSP